MPPPETGRHCSIIRCNASGRRCKWRALSVFAFGIFDVGDRFTYLLDFLGSIVGMLMSNSSSTLHHQFDGVERIRAEIVHKRCFAGDLVFFDPQLFWRRYRRRVLRLWPWQTPKRLIGFGLMDCLIVVRKNAAG